MDSDKLSDLFIEKLFETIESIPLPMDKLNQNMDAFKSQFHQRCEQLKELSNRNKLVLDDLDKLHNRIAELETKTQGLVKKQVRNILHYAVKCPLGYWWGFDGACSFTFRYDLSCGKLQLRGLLVLNLPLFELSLELEVNNVFGQLQNTRQQAQILCSNKELLFSQTKDDLTYYAGEFHLRIEAFFMRNGFRIIFHDIPSTDDKDDKYDEEGLKSQSDPVQAYTLSSTTKLEVVGWVELSINDCIFQLDRCSHPQVKLDLLLRDLNDIKDWKTFFILCRRLFTQPHTASAAILH